MSLPSDQLPNEFGKCVCPSPVFRLLESIGMVHFHEWIGGAGLDINKAVERRWRAGRLHTVPRLVTQATAARGAPSAAGGAERCWWSRVDAALGRRGGKIEPSVASARSAAVSVINGILHAGRGLLPLPMRAGGWSGGGAVEMSVAHALCAFAC